MPAQPAIMDWSDINWAIRRGNKQNGMVQRDWQYSQRICTIQDISDEKIV